MDCSPDEESIDIQLRAPEQIAIRAIILSALAHRGFLELEALDDDSEADGERFDLLSWLRDERLLSYGDPSEIAALQAPTGTLGHEEALSLTWSTEALAPLCWALGLLPGLPAADQAVDAAMLLALTPASGSPTAEFLAVAALRREEDIATAREAAELWYWRATVQDLLNTASPTDRSDLVAAILETAAEGAAQGILPPPAHGDFSVNSGPYALASDHESLALRTDCRLRALNWLCGFGMSWDTVPLDL